MKFCSLKLHPSVIELERVTKTPCMGRFEIDDVLPTTRIEDIISLLQIKLKTDDIFSLSHDGREILCLHSLSIFGDSSKPVVLEYVRSTSRKSHIGVQTERVSRKKRKPVKSAAVSDFPPLGLSRFKYLRIRNDGVK